MRMLEVKNLSFSYDKEEILKNIDIYVDENEIVSLIGGSGSGKTTLFNLIVGTLKIKNGKIFVNENKFKKSKNDLIRKIGYMKQKDLLFEHKNVLDNVILPLILNGEKKEIAKKKGLELLKEFNLEEIKDKYPNKLSGGMKQRIAFIRTLMLETNFYLLDEPFSALDAITKLKIQRWFKNIQKIKKFSVFLITHDIDEAIFLSNRIYILKNYPASIKDEIIIEYNKKTIDLMNLEYKKRILKCLDISGSF